VVFGGGNGSAEVGVYGLENVEDGDVGSFVTGSMDVDVPRGREVGGV